MPVVDATTSVVPVNSDLMFIFMINLFYEDVFMLSSEKIKNWVRKPHHTASVRAAKKRPSDKTDASTINDIGILRRSLHLAGNKNPCYVYKIGNFCKNRRDISEKPQNSGT